MKHLLTLLIAAGFFIISQPVHAQTVPVLMGRIAVENTCLVNGTYHSFFWGGCTNRECGTPPQCYEGYNGTRYTVSWKYAGQPDSMYRSNVSNGVNGGPGYVFVNTSPIEVGRRVIVRINLNGIQNRTTLNSWAFNRCNARINSHHIYCHNTERSGYLSADENGNQVISGFTDDPNPMPQVVYLQIDNYPTEGNCNPDNLDKNGDGVGDGYKNCNTAHLWIRDFRWCGDGMTDSINSMTISSHVNEQCDDGNDVDTDSCSNSCQMPVPTATPPAVTLTPIPNYPVTVNVYESETCTGTVTPDPPFTTTVTITGVETRNIGSTTYTTQFSNVSSATSHQVLLDMPSGWQLSSGAGCVGNSNNRTINVPADNVVNFYLMQPPNDLPWWQTTGGDVGVNNGTFTDPLPTGEYLSLSAAARMHAGMLTYGGIAPVLGGGWWSDRGDDWWTINSEMMTTGAHKEDFSTFTNLMSLNPERWSGSAGQTIQLTSKSTVTGSYATPIPGIFGIKGNVVLNDWVVGGTDVPDEPTDPVNVIFVDGNVVVDAEDFTVAKETFFMIVASGTISFTPTVQEAHGLYVADQILTIEAGSDVFHGEGLFVGWQGVILSRNIGSNNATDPAETFTYRPDFLLNAPPDLRFPEYSWNQTKPTKVNPTGVTPFDTP